MKVSQMTRNGNEITIIVEMPDGRSKTFRLRNPKLIEEHITWEAKAIQIEDEFGEKLKQAEMWRVGEKDRHLATRRSVEERAKVIIIHAEQVAAEALAKALDD